jgi:hypothetical protein
MADVEIDWGSVNIRRGTFTVLLRGAWAHDSTWVQVFNGSVPPVWSRSWGQIAGTTSTLIAWGQIAARVDGKITVQTLHPGNANQLREALEKLVTAANAKMACLAESQQRAEQQTSQVEAEQQARDQAMIDEFRAPES